MLIAVDDTDSVKGNCTTYLATEFVRELTQDLDLIGNPRLVRLNPAVPWKTRGNGALVMEFGTGNSSGRKIGEINGRDIFCFHDGASVADPKEILERLIPVLMRNRSDISDSGLIISDIRPDPSFYRRGVTTILDRKEIEEELNRIGATTFTTGNGRGLIGAMCAMSWVPGDSTFELLAYRKKEKWGTERSFEPLSVMRMEENYPTTFNSWDWELKKPAMIPATPCPVLYGLRGDVMEDLAVAAAALETEERDRWMVFLTNQGTDDHILTETHSLIPNQSYAVTGTVAGKARRLRGGHLLLDMDTKYGPLTCAAYEPSKGFRDAFQDLIPGDKITVLGEIREEPRVLNSEKLHVISMAENIEISNPDCPVCGKKMKSAGKGQAYRCKKCRTKAAETIRTTIPRNLETGWYEPPASSRRHLSKPLKRMGLVPARIRQ